MSEAMAPICLVGQVFVDVTLPHDGQESKVRFGGIVHAARALWAIGQPYVVAYAAPDYLEAPLQRYVAHHGALEARRFATVRGCPNVILIGEVKEAGDQGYDIVLRDEREVDHDDAALGRLLERHCPSEVLTISEGYDLGTVLRSAQAAGARMTVDLTGASDDWAAVSALGGAVDALTLSTSSKLFKEYFGGQSQKYWDAAIPAVAKAALLKENRGGSRLRTTSDSVPVATPAFPGQTQHSVGVGDCFDAVWVALRRRMPDREALAYASLVAADYASTTFPDDFRERAGQTLRIPPAEAVEARGLSLPWEARAQVNVYVAAPDFDYADRRPIDAVAAALAYHNFRPRRPVGENGQATKGSSEHERTRLFAADLALLAECQLVVAVLTYDDPGTLVEIGIACERGLPVIVYDPFQRVTNLFLAGLPNLVTSDIERVVQEVYKQAAILQEHAT